ncbi:hypothetical protein lerEdw1_018743 [Lerista edwardsae]|nr:hypothetical protein lerEdw1_018743 [Lerista edwardsae]
MELPDEDIKFIIDETLDFGLSSPLEGPEEEGSLICPLEPSERCVAQAIDMNILLGESEGRTREPASPWRPLSPEKLEEVMKEANMLAAQLEQCKLREKENAASELRLEKVPELEPLSAVRFLQAERASSRNPRRETFNVKNSPLKALLPTVGPESSSALQSPKTLSPKRGSPAPCVMGSPIPKRTPDKSNNCSADNLLSKKSRPSDSPKTLTPTKSPSSKKSQTNNRKDRLALLPHPGAMQDEKSLLNVKPPPWEPSRKIAGASRQTCSAKESKLSLQDSPRKSALSVAQRKGKQEARSSRLQAIPMKKSSSAQERAVPLQKAKASQPKTTGGDGSQSSSKPHSSSCQIRTRSIATSVLASQLPAANSVPKAASRIATLGRPAVPGKPSQFKPLSLGVPGAKRSTLPVPAVKKGNNAGHI